MLVRRELPGSPPGPAQPEHVGPEAGGVVEPRVEAGIVPVLTVGRRRLADRHLRHGPDLWLAGGDGDALLAVVLVLVPHVVAHLSPGVVLAI